MRDMGIGPRELAEVRGLSRHAVVGAGPQGVRRAADRQIALWRQAGLVNVITRPLNHSRDPVGPKEKGIDVQLAVDFVRLSIEGRFDAGVPSRRTPTCRLRWKAVCELKGADACEVVAWARPGSSPSILRLKDQRLRYHYLDRRWYERLHDPTDYSERRRRRRRRHRLVTNL